MTDFEFDVIVVAETWLTSYTDLLFRIDDYESLCIYKNRFGGVNTVHFRKKPYV